MRNASFKSSWLAAGIILAVVALSYGNSLNNGFHYDDFHTIVKNPAVRSLQSASFSLTDPSKFSLYRTPMIRPIPLISYSANYALDGLRPAGWRLFNLLIHFITALLVRSIVAELFRRRGMAERADMAGLVSGLIFAVHPLQVEAVNYMSARSSLLVAMFYLLSIYLYMLPRGRGLRFASYAAFIMALLSREDAATLPAAVIVLDLLLLKSLDSNQNMVDGRILSRIKNWAPYWVLLGVYFIYRKLTLGIAVSGAFVRTIPENLMLQVWSLGIYQKLFIWPHGYSISHPVGASVVGSAAWVVILIILVAEVAVAAWSFRKRPLLSFSIGWYFLALSPTLIIPLNQVASEHRTYLAMVGPAVIFGLLASWLSGAGASNRERSQARIVVIVMPLMLVLALLARERNTDWLTERSLWNSAVEVHPRDEKAWVRYGIALKDDKDYSGAIAAYRRAIAIEPTSEAYNNLAKACGITGDLDCARSSLETSLSLNPDNPNALYNMAEVMILDGNYEGAETAYRRTLELRPVFPEAHRNLAILLMFTKKGKPEEVLEHLAASLEQDPYQTQADEMRKMIKKLMQDMRYGEGS